MVLELLDKLELSSDHEPGDEPEDELQKDPLEDQEMEELDVEQGMEDAESTMSGDGTGSSSISGEEPEDDFDSVYDPFKDQQDDQPLFSWVHHFLKPHVYSTTG